MERSLVIRLGIAASVLAHVVLVTLIFLSTSVHPYSAEGPEFIPVDIVDPDEPKTTPEAAPTPVPTPSPTPDFNFDMKQGATQAASSASAPPPQQPQQAQPKEKPQRSAKRETAAEPQAAPQPQSSPSPQPQPPQAQPQPQAQPSSAASPQPAPTYSQPEPDLTVKYGVMLGLPSALPPAALGADKPDDKEAAAATTTNLAGNLVAALRSHLKSCAKLPPSVTPSDNVRVKLQVRLAPDGRLAAEPALIEVTAPSSAATKALELKQSAVSALMACQPYTMLPADRYREWRVLELSFAPQDFPG